MEGRSLARGGVILLFLSLLRLGLDRLQASDPLGPPAPNTLGELLEESREVKEERALRGLPLEAGETVDPNRASEVELDRLPGLGPAAARALVARRQKAGGFSGPEDLLEVQGIGPATLDRIRPHLDFSRGIPSELRRVGRRNPVQGEAQPLDLNRASAGELESLPGIGPALAQRILESRARDGPFLRAEDLLRVRGIGPATLEKIRHLISFHD